MNRMYMNFWWPLETSAQVTDKPKRVSALGQEFVLFRVPDGTPQVMSDLCVHRGGALSDGWLENNCIVCPYHGWVFETSGACIKIPANQAGVPVPRKARVDSYPTIERHGFVWGFLGDIPQAERPPVPAVAGLDVSQPANVCGEVTWKAPYENVIAAFADPSVAAMALDGEYELTTASASEVKGEVLAWGAALSGRVTPPRRVERKLGGMVRKVVSVDAMDASVVFGMPSFMAARIGLGASLVMSHLPVDDQTTMTKWLVARPPSPTELGMARMRVNSGLERMRAKVEGGASPRNAVGDTLARLNSEARARGWSIDSEIIEAEYANIKAVVIPSPARREISELAQAWVMKKVPTKAIDS
jgi:nitrite reductase/ring-hydroxylating ferredoxin subunit